jgi:hypothetical protein
MADLAYGVHTAGHWEEMKGPMEGLPLRIMAYLNLDKVLTITKWDDLAMATESIRRNALSYGHIGYGPFPTPDDQVIFGKRHWIVILEYR